MKHAMRRRGCSLLAALLGASHLAAQSRPDDFRTARALEVSIVKRTRLDTAPWFVTRLHSGNPILVASTSGTELAIARDSNSASVVLVFALPLGTLEHHYVVPLVVNDLAWSPDDHRLYFSRTGSGGALACGILDLTSGVATRLPSACLASGTWINDSTLVSAKSRCNLFSLVCDAPTPAQLAQLPGPPFQFLRLEPAVHTVVFPRTSGVGSYGVYAVSTKDSAFRDLGFDPNPSVAVAIVPVPGTSLVAVGGPFSSWLVELGPAPSGPSDVSVETVSLTDSEEAARLPDLLRDGAVVGADICPPLTNPINGRIVGADCSRVKARVKFELFNSGWLRGRVKELYEPVAAGDVARVRVEGTAKVLHQQPWVVLKADNFLVWTTPLGKPPN